MMGTTHSLCDLCMEFFLFQTVLLPPAQNPPWSWAVQLLKQFHLQRHPDPLAFTNTPLPLTHGPPPLMDPKVTVANLLWSIGI